MHLDTLMTMIDRATFVLYPYIDRHFRSWTIAPAGESLKVTHNRSLAWDALAEAIGVDAVTVLVTDEDIRAAEREQWDDGTNYLAVAPGVILGYDRNARHQHHAAQAWHRGDRGARQRDSAAGAAGPRCMTCPIERDPALANTRRV